jgi:hypothetical protein
MASLFDDELERQRKQLAEAGVTAQMIADAPNVAEAQSLLPVPLSPIEKMIERDGKGKTFGKMLLGGFTGLTPLLMPELIGGRERYKAELDVYNDQLKRQLMSEQSSPYRKALANNDKSDDFEAIEQLAMLYPDIYGPVLRDMQKNKYAPNPATYTEGKFQWDPNYSNEDGSSGRYFLGRQSSDGTYKKEYQDQGFVPKSFLPSSEYIEGQISDYSDEFLASEQRYDDIVNLEYQMDQIGEDAWGTGAPAQAKEQWKKFTGTEDPESMARKAYDRIKVTKAIGNLPPGVASDKDIELVLQPFPTSFTNYQQLREYLAGLRRAEQKIMELNKFRSNYIKENRTEAGLPEAWQSKWSKDTSEGGMFYRQEEDGDALGLDRDERAAFDAWKKAKGL